MKALKHVLRVATVSVLAVTLTSLVSMPTNALAQEKGASKLMQSSRIQSKADVEALMPGDMVVMSCPKCKDTHVAVVEKSWKTGVADSTKTVTVHLCPGCETKFVPQPNKQPAKAVHICKNCGSEDVTCCTVKKDGYASTPGMK